MFFSRSCVIGIVILGFVEGAVGQKSCRDCVPYTYCKAAKELADSDTSSATVEKFRHSYCGMHKEKIKVCCSEFDVPNLNSRWRPGTGSSHTELPIKPLNIKLLMQNSNSGSKPVRPNKWIFPELLNNGSQPEHPNKILLPDSCGTIALDRIIGGTEARLYEFPWMVLIAYGDDYRFGCAGSLINSRFVLTAAHCVVSKDYKIARIGDFDLQTEIDCQGNICEKKIQDIEIKYNIVHDDYNLTSYKNDIALLYLKDPVEMPLKNANAVCLPTTTEMQSESISNQMALVAGWGLTELGSQSTILRKVNLPIRSSSYCFSFYSHLSDPESNQFCAGDLKKDSCRGDSGGPLIMETTINGETKYVQYGIISYGKEECGTSAPGIYTDVRKYIKWIYDNIKS